MKFGLKQTELEALQNCFAAHPHIEEVILYGSRAKGTFKNGSDIDITICDSGMTYTELMQLEIELDDLLLPYTIDLSLKRWIQNKDLLDHINRVGKVLYGKG
jgi:predicted nucleotidyltransferase